MNYRHAFHAGNFADVVKHAVMARILVRLAEKPAAFRVIDTHAGAGRYDLAGAEAMRTAEWRGGIGRLRGASLPAGAAALLEPYLAAVAAHNPDGTLRIYPGSPLIALALMRAQDRLLACETEPGAAFGLTQALRGDRRAAALDLDGWTALNAHLPPKERRALVLIDPPFEATGEFARLAQTLAAAHRKWATGIYLLWYPVKDRAETAAFARRLARLAIPKMLRAELIVPSATGDGALSGTGLIAVNPPWTLHGELKEMLPALAAAMSRGGRDGVVLEWLTGENGR